MKIQRNKEAVLTVTKLYGTNSYNPFIPNGIKLKIKANETYYIGEFYQDENGNCELYVPENEWHTDFFIKLPRNFEIDLDSSKNIPEIII